jgi:hypothetical protein
MYVKKKRPGGTSHGYQWPKAGMWVEMDAEDAHELVTIQPDEFEAQPELPRGAKLHKASDPDDDQVPPPAPDPEE